MYRNTMEALKLFGAERVSERFVQQGKIVTAAGVSAGIDMALWLVALERGEAMAQQVQLPIEYHPRPTFRAGSPSKATAAMIDNAK